MYFLISLWLLISPALSQVTKTLEGQNSQSRKILNESLKTCTPSLTKFYRDNELIEMTTVYGLRSGYCQVAYGSYSNNPRTRVCIFDKPAFQLIAKEEKSPIELQQYIIIHDRDCVYISGAQNSNTKTEADPNEDKKQLTNLKISCEAGSKPNCNELEKKKRAFQKNCADEKEFCTFIGIGPI